MLVDMSIFATENPPKIFPFFSYKSVISERLESLFVKFNKILTACPFSFSSCIELSLGQRMWRAIDVGNIWFWLQSTSARPFKVKPLKIKYTIRRVNNTDRSFASG